MNKGNSVHIRGKTFLVLHPLALPHGPGCMWIATYSSQKADCYIETKGGNVILGIFCDTIYFTSLCM